MVYPPGLFQCRICSTDVFGQLFGGDEDPEDESAIEPWKDSRMKNSSRAFRRRSEEEVRITVREWEKYVHPRALEYFRAPGKLQEVLGRMARSLDKTDDPVQGCDDYCVRWRGETMKGPSPSSDNESEDDMVASHDSYDFVGDHRHRRQAIFRMVKPGDNQETVTYVNRILAFAFAADESFEELMKLPKQPFRMSCGNQLCVHIAHISIEP
mmetsp:Transcript_98014/g.277534  ORF Transcript_98014/g.277534 Transcript_98014/m.277534 type:complete len:211 (-) Transcript_98014:80-712(-)